MEGMELASREVRRRMVRAQDAHYRNRGHTWMQLIPCGLIDYAGINEEDTVVTLGDYVDRGPQGGHRYDWTSVSNPGRKPDGQS